MNPEPWLDPTEPESCRPSSPPASILVVADTPANLELLTLVLQQNGHAIRTALNSTAALQSIAESHPDLGLLDARLPSLDGYAVCHQLKAAGRTRDIPVIFISGLLETEDKLKAFAAGGVDNVTKPFQIPEVMLRVNTQLNQIRLQRTLAEQNRKLDEIVQQRTQELLAVNRQLALLNRTKNDFFTLIFHELRTPLNGLLGAAELAFGNQTAGSRDPELHQIFEVSRHRLMCLLDDAQLVTEIQLTAKGHVFGSVRLEDVLASLQPAARELASHWRFDPAWPPAALGPVMGESVILQKALPCLLKTCLQWYPTESSGEPRELVSIAALAQPEAVSLTFTTCQHSLSAADLDCFFEVLTVSKPFPGGDLGLAPALAACIVSLLGGHTEIHNLEPAGIEIKIHLPRPPIGQARVI
jgi:DNA-binding response OmpR family regulator